jgi:ribosomal protein S18 acetylase RimI-like enzyme
MDGGQFFFRLSVAKDYRNKGIGSLLLEKIEDILAAKCYQEVYCLVKNSDTQIKDYYKKCELEEGEKPYRVMVKAISSKLT